MKTTLTEQKEKSGWLNHSEALKVEAQMRAEERGLKVDRYALVKKGGIVMVTILRGIKTVSFSGRGNNDLLKAIKFLEAC